MGIRYTSPEGRQFRFAGLFADFAMFFDMVGTEEHDGQMCLAEDVFSLTKDQVGCILRCMDDWFDTHPLVYRIDTYAYELAHNWYQSANNDDVMSFG